MKFRVFYTAGPGDIINAHGYWRRNEHCPTEVNLTSSGQLEQACQDLGAEAYLVGYHARKEIVKDGAFTLEHRPKPMPGASGVRYHLSEILYGLGLLATAVRFRADVAVIDSGSTHFFVTSLFRMMGIRVIPVLHNTLWPHGFPPTRRIHRAILALDSFFFRHVATAVIGVSPECTRQVEELTQGPSPPMYQARAQFPARVLREDPPSPSVRPATVPHRVRRPGDSLQGDLRRPGDRQKGRGPRTGAGQVGALRLGARPRGIAGPPSRDGAGVDRRHPGVDAPLGTARGPREATRRSCRPAAASPRDWP